MNCKVILALVLAIVTLFATSSSRKSKDVQGKAVSLKTKLHHKTFHHNDHHHHYHHHHHPHVHYNHDKHKHLHHHRHHHHHHHHHHHPLKHYHHYSHHHRHLHHHHNPWKHYLRHLHHHRHPHHHHQGHNHHHSHHHPLHQQSKKKLEIKLQPDHVNHHDNRRSHISHPPQLNVPSKLKLHVQINNAEAVKRNSLPELLSSLGQNLVKLGTSMSHKKSQSEVLVNSSDSLDRKEDVTHAIPVPQFSFGAEGLSANSAVIPAHAPGKSVTAKDLEVLLHKALDGASGDHVDSASGSGSGRELADTNTNASPTDKGSLENPDRRNETFPEEPGYHSSEALGGYDSEYGTHNSPSTHDQAAKESVQRETKGTESDDKELSQFFRNEKIKNVASKKMDQAEMADTQAKQFGQIQDNGGGSEPSSLTNQSLFEEPRRPDMNATFEDTEGNADKEMNKSVLKQHEEPVITHNDDQDTSENKEEKTGASGSGDEASTETSDDTDEHTEAEEKLYRGEVNVKGLSNFSTIDKDENGSGDSLGQNGIRNIGDGESGQDVLINQMAKQEPFYETNNTVAEGTLDKQTKESRNQNEASLDQISTNEPLSQGSIDASASTESTIDQSAPKESKAFSQITAAKDVDVLPSGDFQTPMAQSVLDEVERVKLRTDVEKGVATENEGTAIQDANYQQNQLNQFKQLDRIAQTKPDEVAGSQEVAEENALKDNLRPQIYNATFSDGPSFNTAYSTGMDVEGNQSADLREVTSPENSSIDDSEEIPVYTLSSPRSEDAVENAASPVFTTPTSSITTASATYLEPGLPTEEESTFTTLDTPPQDQEERYTPPTERIGFQRDMLDDPVEESLETTVDSKSS